MADREYPKEHIGDGVYAEWNGAVLLLRVNSHLNDVAVTLEPFVIKNLIEFYEYAKNKK